MKEIKMCSEDKKRKQTVQRKGWMDIMKCENSVRETSEAVAEIGPICVEQEGIKRG